MLLFPLRERYQIAKTIHYETFTEKETQWNYVSLGFLMVKGVF